MMRNLVILILIALFSVGCFQGRPSKEPPIHWNPSMDNQPKYKTQEPSNFFEDGSAMRMPVEGTVARGWLRDDLPYYTGRYADSSYVVNAPVKVDMNMLLRGQERFNIYCSPCHGRTGQGQGIVVKRGMLPPPSFFDTLITRYPDGRVFEVISNGIRNMPSYRHQIPVEDRWAIITYFNALQRSQGATVEDVPVHLRER